MKVAEKYTDAELIAAITSGKHLDPAIHSLYRQFSEAIRSFIMSYGGNEQDADDVFQETVIAFIDSVKKGKYRQESSVKTFLASVARHIWFNDLKKKERAGIREKKYESTRDQHESDISHQIGDIEQRRQLRDLLTQLGEPCNKLLHLFYYENLPMKEIVEHLPYENEQVVRNKKYKCLQQLTGLLKANPALAGQLNELIK